MNRLNVKFSDNHMARSSTCMVHFIHEVPFRTLLNAYHNDFIQSMCVVRLMVCLVSSYIIVDVLSCTTSTPVTFVLSCYWTN